MAIRRRPTRPAYTESPPDDIVPHQARPNWIGEDRFDGLDATGNETTELHYRDGNTGVANGRSDNENVTPKIGFRTDRTLDVQTVDPDRPIDKSDPHIHVLKTGRAVDDRVIGAKYSHRDDWQSRDRNTLGHGLSANNTQIVDKHTRPELLQAMDSVRRDFIGARGNKEMVQRLEHEMTELREIAEAEATVRDILYDRRMTQEFGAGHDRDDDGCAHLGYN